MYATSTQIKAFTAVAQERGFEKAAKKMGLTQPAVTIQVRALEDAYGIVLFDRRGAEVKMTPIGRELFSLTHQIRNLEEEVDDLLSAQYELVSGSLTLVTGSPQITMDLVGRFQRRYPQCNIDVSIGNHSFIWEEILERRADIAMDTGIPHDDRVVVLPYCINDIVLLLPKDHALAGKKSVGLKELANERLIIRSDKSITQQIVQDLFHAADVKLVPSMFVGSREAVREAVAAGLGAGFVFNMEIGEDSRLTAIKINQKSVRNVESVICLKAQARRRLVKVFLDLVRELQSPEAKNFKPATSFDLQKF